MRTLAAGFSVGILLAVGVAGTMSARAQPPHGGPGGPGEVASSHRLQWGATTLQVDFAAGSFDLPAGAILSHVEKAAKAVTAFYGKFPVPGARVLIVPVPGDRGMLQGTTWGAV